MKEKSDVKAKRPCCDSEVDIATRKRVAEGGRVAGYLGAVTLGRREGDPEMLERSAKVLDYMSAKTLQAPGLEPDQAAELSRLYTDAAELVRKHDPLVMQCALNRVAAVCIGTCARDEVPQ